MSISHGKIVEFHYTLKNDAGEVLDSSSGGEPLSYLHGAGNIIPGLESALEGKNVGDHLDVKVAAKDGYGERVGPGPQAVPRTDFPEGMNIQPGMQFGAQDQDGNHFPVWVTGVENDTIHIDVNHPLAGQQLHFAVDIVSVRDASAEEMQHGHPHGPGGHHHGH